MAALVGWVEGAGILALKMEEGDAIDWETKCCFQVRRFGFVIEN